jgi:3-methyladenine DNA glycosylase AlkC
MAQGFSLKDQLFNREKVRYLAGLFHRAMPDFEPDIFEARVMAELPALELKARISWIAEVLSGTLPADFAELDQVIRRALPPPLDPSLSDDDFGDFIFAPLGELVVLRGLPAAPAASLDLLEALTQRFSMEWAIRPFLNHVPGETLARMEQWTEHSSYHVRRLASEGSRPRLPWGQAVGLSLTDTLPILDRLHADPTRYVTRSVANHLNDISKKDPDLACQRITAWRVQEQQTAKELDWIASHALRGLIKAGHPDAMRLLGYDPEAEVAAELRIDGPVRIGEALRFSCDLQGQAGQPVLVDYRITFLRPGGKSSAKVFKLKQAQLKARGLSLEKRHALKGNATTFTLVPGHHHLELMINGRVAATAEFELLPEG